MYEPKKKIISNAPGDPFETIYSRDFHTASPQAREFYFGTLELGEKMGDGCKLSEKVRSDGSGAPLRGGIACHDRLHVCCVTCPADGSGKVLMQVLKYLKGEVRGELKFHAKICDEDHTLTGYCLHSNIPLSPAPLPSHHSHLVPSLGSCWLLVLGWRSGGALLHLCVRVDLERQQRQLSGEPTNEPGHQFASKTAREPAS